ncbi:MAG TPA: S8 family serine peptidase [Thermoleophilaceae bacterium]|nr:S8 family serine peptidase [Thermoleophilaceae bacterium]
MRRPFYALAALTAAAFLILASSALAADYVPGRVIVKYRHGAPKVVRATVQRRTHTAFAAHVPGGSHMLRLTGDQSVPATISALKRNKDVEYAVPDYVAHASFIPNDPGLAGTVSGWQSTQWDMTGPFSMNAPLAWDEAIAAGAPGGSGVIVAVLDTGVAYENYKRFRKAPDLHGGRFVRAYDFVDNDRHANDENGHGTHVTMTIAEATNNGIGLTGLAYGVKIMPLRVLDSEGAGDAIAISRAIRYAARRGAKVINMSLEFDTSVTASEIPEIVSAVRYAHHKNVVMVAASGNEADNSVAYPARTTHVISVGAITKDGCQADYSNGGSNLKLVAPGGGSDAPNNDNPNDQANCHPGIDEPPIFQQTFSHDGSVRSFALRGSEYEGTSMASPHVAAAAALLIASKRLGSHPSANAVEQRLEHTALDLGPVGYDTRYGFGEVQPAAALGPQP